MKRRIISILAAILPEILTYPLVICIGALFSDPLFDIFGFLNKDIKWLWGAVLVPAGMGGLSISRIDDLLSPKGNRSLLLSWPDYQLFKDLAVSTIALYCLGQIVAFIGFYVVAISKHPFGLILILAAVVQVMFTFCTLVLANWKSREILRE